MVTTVTTQPEARAGHVVGSVEEQRMPIPVAPPPQRTRVEWNGLSGVREVRVRLLKRRGRAPGADHGPGDRSEQLLGEVCEPLS